MEDLPDGYDGALVRSVEGHEAQAGADRTGMVFPESGRYVVPEALHLVDIDRDADRGVYVEENLWIRHL